VIAAADFALVRGALFPFSAIETLAAPSAPALRDLPPEEASPDGQAAYARSYDEVIELERARLWERTAGSAHFMKALAAAHPELAVRVIGTALPAPRNKRTRHLETTLYRYLARAVGRPVPGQLWAGVALAGFGPTTRLHPISPRALFEPDLRPFQLLLRALGESRRQAGLWKLNPTLGPAPEAAAGWVFFRRDDGGRLRPLRMQSHPTVDACLRGLSKCSPLPWSELEQEAARHSGLSPESVAAGLEQLRAAGVLVGGLDLNWRFSSAWDALLGSARSLQGPQRRAWISTYRAVRGICRTLSREFSSLDAAALIAAQKAVAAEVNELAVALNCAPPPPRRAPLFCDAALPLDIQLGEDLRDLLGHELAQAVSRKLQHPHATPRPAQVHPLRISPGATPGGPVDAERFAIPFGCLLASLAGGGLSPQGLCDFLPLYSRHWRLWGEAGVPADPAYAWQRTTLRARAQMCGVKFAELTMPYEYLEYPPNLLARPPLFDRVVSVWSAVPGETSLAGARLRWDGRSPAPVVELQDEEHPLVVVAPTAAVVEPGDELSHRLLWSSLRCPPRATVPSEAAPSGSGAFPNAVSLHGEALQGLLREPPPRRFACWARFVQKHGFGPFVKVGVDGQQPLLVIRDSPLALESLLEGAGNAAQLVVSNFAQEGLLRDESGERRCVELALPFQALNRSYKDSALAPQTGITSNR
jgi:hypothetical protein